MTRKGTNSIEAPLVSSDRILHGVFFTLRQAWELLCAAQILQANGKFSSAYGMAVFCREEIGKSKLLEKHWGASMSGKPVTVRDLNSGELRSHSIKLRAAGKVLSVVGIAVGVPPDPSSDDGRELFGRIHEMNVRAREADPDSTHLARQRAFYVEMHEAGVGWWTPWTAFDSPRSDGEIREAECEYLLRRCELEALRKRVGNIDIVLANGLYLPPELAPA